MDMERLRNRNETDSLILCFFIGLWTLETPNKKAEKCMYS